MRNVVGSWSAGMGLVGMLCAAHLQAAAGRFADYTIEERVDAPAVREDYIILDVKDKDLREVLSVISRKVGVNIVTDPQVDEKITVTLDRVEWRLALQHIARLTNCRIVEESERLIRFTQPPVINMEFQDADLRIVLDLLAKQSGANIVIASDVKGAVSLSLREVPWEDALQTIVKTAGYTIVEDHLGSAGTKILRVVHPDSLVQQLEATWIQLRYVRPDAAYKAVITNVQNQAMSPFLTEDGKVSAELMEEDREFSLLAALEQILSEHGKIQYDRGTNSLYVKDIKTRVDEIKAIVAQIDKEPPQVHVQVKFVVTTSADLLETGLRFVNTTTGERRGLNAYAQGAPSMMPPVQYLDAMRDANDLPINSFISDKLLYWGGQFPFDLGRWGSPVSGFHALGVLNLQETRLMMEFIKDDDASRVVQQPELTTLDKVPATIFVGESVPFAEQSVSYDQNGNMTVVIKENKRSPVNVGFTLYIVPNVIPNSDDIDLNVIPKISSLVGRSSPLDGFERFVVGQTFIDLPRESTQTVVTSMRVQHGHTALIGGLQTERRTEITTRIPLISSIPILGHIFTYRYQRHVQESVLIMLTPKIMQNTDMLQTVCDRALAEVQKRDHFHQKALKQHGNTPEQKD